MKARVESDGTPKGTKVFDAEGREIKGISRVTFSVEVGYPSEVMVTLPLATCSVEANQLRRRIFDIATGRSAEAIGFVDPEGKVVMFDRDQEKPASTGR